MRAALAIAWKELLYLRAYPLDLVNYAISPALLVAPYILTAKLFGMGAELVDSVAVGLILWYWLSTIMWDIAFGLSEEMEEGIFETLMITPSSVWAVLAGRTLATLFLNAYITAAMLGWFALFHVRLDLPWASFWAVLFLTGVGIVGFMFGLSSLVLLWKDMRGDFLQTAFGVLSGMTMPARRLPRPFWLLSRALPLAYGIEAARRLLAGGGFAQEVPVLLALGAAYGFLGWLGLRWAARRMQALGTTGEF